MTAALLHASREARDNGMAAAVGHAERVTPRWAALARDQLGLYLARDPGEFVAAEFRLWAQDRIEAPPDPRAWGGVVVAALRRGEIVPCGWREYGDATSNSSYVRVWRGVA